MSVLSSEVRRLLERAVVGARGVAERGCGFELERLGVVDDRPAAHLGEGDRLLRRRLRVRLRQLGGDVGVLVSEAAYEQWHRLLFARFLTENGLLVHPGYGAPLTLAQCAELAESLGEPDSWGVAGRFAAEILPGVFRLDDPLTQLRLAPEHRVALERAVEGLSSEVFTSDDGLGWVYQFWQSEAKDAVNASERKIGGADLAPVTQLFTENYMVRFLLENSLGAWWAARHPDSPLIKEWEFLRFDEEGRPAAGGFEGWPDTVAEVTVMDPCCGSGHFLVEAFGMLWRMRAEEEGLSDVAAQDAVLRDNLFGLELDPRCTELAAFNLVLTAWKTGGYRDLPVPNIACSGIAVKAPLEEWTALAGGDARLGAGLERLHLLFRDADTLGSLIDPRRAAEMDSALGQRPLDSVEWAEIIPLFEQAVAKEADDPAAAVLGADAAAIAKAADYLSRRYSLAATNPPFLGRNSQDATLARACELLADDAKYDLATSFLHRALWGSSRLASIAAFVIPQAFLGTERYTAFRRRLLTTSQLALYAKLGDGAFDTISGAVVNVGLVVVEASPPTSGFRSVLVDASAVASKGSALRSSVLREVDQFSQLQHPGHRITFEEPTGVPYLGECVETHQGIATSDGARFVFKLWEVPFPRLGWSYLQSAPTGSGLYRGREDIIFWEDGDGRITEVCQKGATFRGQAAWAREGVVVAQMSALSGTLYTGDRFDGSAVALIPRHPADRSALWHFVATGAFEESVRAVDSKLRVANATMAAVPFDLEHWREVASAAGPLPEPWSDDPTQWLFEGDPVVATEPLQVAVARLVGYRWPEQPEESPLDDHADSDGVVCLPSVGGEQAAAWRLEALLAGAYGGDWSAGSARRLIASTGSKKKNLADWLRDDFFMQHCKMFANRPFVWHIWDGRKDGFSALVHYHRLDRGLLEKLTFNTLGWWIERQRADAERDEPGAADRLGAARDLQGRLKLILEGEAPYDVFVRWKELWEQPIGWEPDLDDGVRLNVRPFVEADVLRSNFNVHWRKDRGKNPDGSERHNDLHPTLADKRKARQEHRT